MLCSNNYVILKHFSNSILFFIKANLIRLIFLFTSSSISNVTFLLVTEIINLDNMKNKYQGK